MRAANIKRQIVEINFIQRLWGLSIYLNEQEEKQEQIKWQAWAREQIKTQYPDVNVISERPKWSERNSATWMYVPVGSLGRMDRDMYPSPYVIKLETLYDGRPVYDIFPQWRWIYSADEPDVVLECKAFLDGLEKKYNELHSYKPGA